MMSIASRYLAGRFFVMFLLLMPSLVAVYLIVDAFEKLSDFVEASVPFTTVILYFFFSSPRVVVELSPLMILLAGLLAALTLAKNNELLALKAVGATPTIIIVPFLSAALFTASLITGLNVFVFPDMIRKADRIMQVEVMKDPPKGMIVGDRLYYRGQDSVLSARVEMVDGSILSDLEIYTFSDDYRLKDTLMARKAIFDISNGVWDLYDGIFCNIMEGTASEYFEQMEYGLYETPEDFVALRVPVTEAGVLELWDMVQRLKGAGLSSYKPETLLWSKIFYSFIGVSLLWVFMPLILLKRSGGPLAGLVIGGLAGFAMWFIWSLGVTLGVTGKIPPVSAPLGINIILFAAGALIYKKTGV